MSQDFPREFKFNTGKSFLTLFQEPRFGHWKVKPEKGPLPLALSGSFLTYEIAVKHIKAYLNTVKKEIKEVVNG